MKNIQCHLIGIIDGEQVVQLEEVLDEAHLTKDYIFEGIRKFVKDKDLRIKKIKEYLNF